MGFAKIINIAVFVAGLDEEYQSNIVSGINDLVRKTNINVSYFAAYGGMIDSRSFDIGEYSIYDLADLSKFDAAILMTNTINDSDQKKRIADRVKAAGIPAVVFDCDDYEEFINISIDNTSAMKDMVRHVITEHGAKVINYISGPMTNPEAVARLGAFREVMAENGIEVEEDRIYYGEFRSSDGQAAIEKYIESGLALPDAFICANDAMAVSAVNTLEKFGFCVPLDVIVTGFDNTFSARNSSPALTTVRRPLAEMGQLACNMLLDVLAGKEPEYRQLEASCVFTESCGCGENSPAGLRELRKANHTHTVTAKRNVRRLNKLSARLAEVENEEEYLAAVRNFLPTLECRRFALCLVSSWLDRVNTDMTANSFENMTAPMIWSPEGEESVDFFRGSDMFPIPQTTAGNTNYFLPLHFRDKVLGYFVISNSDFPTSTLLCHTFAMTVSNFLENLRKHTHLNKAMEELNRIYVIDPLSGIYNRNGFIKATNELFAKCVEERRKVMLTFVDMDGLKYINDNFGHDEGDFAIQRFATVIKECCRGEDVCARFGGDEFVIFWPNAGSDSSERLKALIEVKLASMNAIINKPYTISASYGSCTSVVSEDDTLYSIIKQADDLMYEVKKKKKGSRTAMDIR